MGFELINNLQWGKPQKHLKVMKILSDVEMKKTQHHICIGDTSLVLVWYEINTK